VRRVVVIVFLSLGVIIWNVDDETLVLKPILISFVVFYFVTKQKDDVAISLEYFLHVKRSVLPVFTRIDKYKLEDMISIRCGGIHNDGWELVDFFNGGGNMGGHSNKIEMIFKDGSSKSLDLRISRDNLDKIVSLAKRLKQKIDLKENKNSNASDQ
jgi:hypothetical protein